MNRSTGRVAFPALFVGLIVLLAGCMDASLSQSGDAPAGISILGAPGAISEADISITGGGANISETIGAGTTELVFELPVGRQHEIEVDTSNFIGRRSFTLPAGGLQVNVRMQEKLFVPDQSNGRLAQIDYMNGGDWNSVDFRGNWALDPYDVELGPNGMIYVASQGDGDSVMVFESTTDDNPSFQTSWGAQAIGIDYDQEYLYVGMNDSGSLSLERRALDGSEVVEYADAIADFVEIWGLAVAKDGDVYVSGIKNVSVEISGDSTLVDRPVVRRFSPDSAFVPVERIIGPDVPSDSDPEIDVTYNDGKVYVTNPSGARSNKIVQLDANTLEPVNSFGSFPADPADPDQGELYGPRRFVATGNSMITVIDEFADSENVLNYDRLVQFAPDGSDWETFGATGTDESEFRFFEHANIP